MARITTLPDSHRDLLEQPNFAVLGTVGPCNEPHTSVMWYVLDDDRIKMTHTKTRQKYRNIQRDPRVSLTIADPANPYRYLEVRGVVEKIEDDDSKASFYKNLQYRYGKDYEVPDADVRVILTIRPESFFANG